MEDTKKNEVIQKWEEETPLYTQLPINYKTGVTLTELDCECLICNTIINPEQVHGKITQTLENVYSVEAMGWCQPCNTLTPFFCRVRGDSGQLVLEWIDKKKGWVRSSSQKGFIEKLLKWIN